MITNELPASDIASYDYLIVGGGTAGCVIASRLAEYLPHKRILLIEAGPSDFMDNRILELKKWLNLIGGDLDFDYTTTEQPMGNSHIRHSRAKVLGGCSSHNTMISFSPFAYDMEIWQSLGAKGWTFDEMARIVTQRLRNTIQTVDERHQSQLCRDWLDSCSQAMKIPIIQDFNKHINNTGGLTKSCGFLPIAYNPDNGHRSSASVAYIHPLLRGDEKKPNLTILTNAWVSKINVSKGTASCTGVDVKLQNGQHYSLAARAETILCAGAIDTPRLMLHSGLGPTSDLEKLSIPVVQDLPGVGQNLQDHPETLIMWELKKPVPRQTTMDTDAAIFLRREAPNAAATASPQSPFNPRNLPDDEVADVMIHCYQGAFTFNTDRLGYKAPPEGYAFCMNPNIPRPRSRGRLYLTSNDPSIKPALDFQYFTDKGGYDAATFVYCMRMARKIAQQSPFKDWIKCEVAPGPELNTDEELSEYVRRVAHTVYHPSGTTKMGDLAKDDMAVCDPEMRVKHIEALRICDAGLFPALTSVNPMVTVLCVAEIGAEMVARQAGWDGKTGVEQVLDHKL
ncbi:Choline oxidase [Cyphellophora attinorum]|uniref:Choline oxidase n=1 Tax=Cyphellophora attinorum TaxID=1664694 RepID=A0A0N1H900_9EURO|nr:Choline oxidase [Phialophora attinorum]KPI43793.1 Choline oxidase [Phialophora attinorum]